VGWSIAQVARMSGVTSRTLRHYDEIGLLPPARIGSNGYRWYEQEQLIRLQQILLLRELGLGLDLIERVLDGTEAPAEVLSRHRRWLLEERDRFDRLAGTVTRTMAQLEGGGQMATEELFDGFDADRQARYEAELVDRYGDHARDGIAESKRRTQGWARQDYQAVGQQMVAVEERLVRLLESEAAVDDPRVLDAVDEHYRLVDRFWTPERESYAGLGRMYVEHPEFRARYDARHPGLAEYLRDAMAAYAAARLS
jgi:MerR family transcriptional regulator, thiopeptide resistance regulator